MFDWVDPYVATFIFWAVVAFLALTIVPAVIKFVWEGTKQVLQISVGILGVLALSSTAIWLLLAI